MRFYAATVSGNKNRYLFPPGMKKKPFLSCFFFILSRIIHYSVYICGRNKEKYERKNRQTA